jgi:hypothetical protein
MNKTHKVRVSIEPITPYKLAYVITRIVDKVELFRIEFESWDVRDNFSEPLQAVDDYLRINNYHSDSILWE